LSAGRGQGRGHPLRLFHGCIAAIVLGVFVAVILPALVWAVSILLAGSR
jgi:hypothetical protein